eukprot:753106-Hanusia_phi.AAC.1
MGLGSKPKSDPTHNLFQNVTRNATVGSSPYDPQIGAPAYEGRSGMVRQHGDTVGKRKEVKAEEGGGGGGERGGWCMAMGTNCRVADHGIRASADI